MKSIKDYFTKSEVESINNNFIKSVGKDWMLITASNKDKINPMSASWGTMGVLWNKPVAICFIRPSRYTYKLVNEAKNFTLNFLPEEERKILQICGSTSGRDSDKISTTGLKPLLTEASGIAYEQARLCLDCSKIYFDELKPENFLMPGTDKKFYPNKDHHRMYIGEIINCYVK